MIPFELFLANSILLQNHLYGYFFIASSFYNAQKYYVVLDYRLADGSRHRKWISTGLSVAGSNARAAKRKLHEIIVEYQDYEQYLEQNDRFTDYIKQWLEREKDMIDQATWNSYEFIVLRHILPYFEPLNYSLTDITPVIL